MLKHSSQQEKSLWALLLAFIIAYVGILTWASQSLETNPHALTTPLAIIFMIASGFVYLGIPRLIGLANGQKRPFLLLLVFSGGLAARFAIFGGETFFENDYFRYLWDGAVLANFHSPFGYAPLDVIEPAIVNSTKINSLIALSHDAEGVVENINYPFLSTVYPIVAQMFFAVAYWLDSFSLNAWRLVLLAADIANFLLIVELLRMAGRTRLWSAIYWLNPLVIGEFFNSAHVDLLIFPFLLLAFILSIRGWAYSSVVLLVLATAVKIWPILLLPLLLRPYAFSQFRKTFLLIVTFVGLSFLLFLPLITEALSHDAGLAAYAQSWRMNDTFYQLVFGFSSYLVSLLGSSDMVLSEYNAHRLARLLIAAAVGLVAIFVALKPWKTVDQLVGRSLVIVAVMFLLSPTQFPWYYCWLVPLLAIRPVSALLVITATMPLYYTRFIFEADKAVGIYDNYIVWLIMVPAIIVFIRDGFSAKSNLHLGKSGV